MVTVRFVKHGVKNTKGFSHSSANKATVQAVAKAMYEPEFFEDTYGEEFEIYEEYKPRRIFISIT
jgi:hypothetical protein